MIYLYCVSVTLSNPYVGHTEAELIISMVHVPVCLQSVAWRTVKGELVVPRQLQPHRKKELSHKQQLVTPLWPCKNRDNAGEKVGGLPFLLEPSEDEEDLALLWSYLWWRAEGLRVEGRWVVGDQGPLVWSTAMGTNRTLLID